MAAARRRYQGKRSPSGCGTLILVLVVVAIVIRFIWWFIGAFVLVALFFVLRAVIREKRTRREALARYCAEVAARADQQHNWVMQGDDRGFYGPEGAKLMQYIRSGGTREPSTSAPSPVTQWRAGPFGTRFAS